MKTILVDAVHCFAILSEGSEGKLEASNGVNINQNMLELLKKYPNRKILLTGANDEEFRKFGLDRMPYEVFTLKHEPEKI